MINLTIATSIRYGNYKFMSHNTKRWQRVIERNWALICKAIGVDDTLDITINWRPIKGATKGSYCSVNNRINMDSRKFDNTLDMIDTLGHELTHFKQYKEGQLDQDWNDDTHKWECVWQGKRYKQASTWNAYFNRPWEQEARKGGSMVLAAFTRKIKALRKTQKVPVFAQKAPEEV
jgi:hypothetical protein